MRKAVEKPDFSGVFLYQDMEDSECDRVLVLAVAGYDKAQDAAYELEITNHKARYLFGYLQKRDALFGGKGYKALEQWASESPSTELFL